MPEPGAPFDPTAEIAELIDVGVVSIERGHYGLDWWAAKLADATGDDVPSCRILLTQRVTHPAEVTVHPVVFAFHDDGACYCQTCDQELSAVEEDVLMNLLEAAPVHGPGTL